MEDLKADVVIIGAGSAGLSTALTASSEKANVIILEKMPFPGGNSLFDDQSKEVLIDKGTHVSLGIFLPVGSKLANLNEEIENGIEDGKAFKAKSIEELADKIPVDRKVLRGTIRMSTINTAKIIMTQSLPRNKYLINPYRTVRGRIEV